MFYKMHIDKLYFTWTSKYCTGGPVLSYVNSPKKKEFVSSTLVKPCKYATYICLVYDILNYGTLNFQNLPE